MFNPNAKVELVALPGQYPCVVIDDFLLAPELLVEGAVKFRDSFTLAPHNAFPGLEMRMPEGFSARLNEFFIQHIRKLLGARRTISNYSRLSMVTHKPHELSAYQRLCHRDKFTIDPTQCFAACVLYLFRDPSLGGTSFYAPKIPDDTLSAMYAMDSDWRSIDSEECTRRLAAEPAYLTASNRYFELIRTVPAAWNRVIFYDGSIFHSAHIEQPQLLSDDPQQGRLTLNGFFTCRRSVGAE